MKKLMNLKGAKTLSKMEQKSINGGYLSCFDGICPRNFPYCVGNTCWKYPQQPQ